MTETKTAQYKGFGGGGGASSLATAASALRLAAKDLGMRLSEQQLRILLGHAAFESGFGMDGVKNSLRNTNNWGAIQATKPFAKAHANEPGYGAVAHQDSDPVRGTFIGWYAVNPTPEAGAKQFLRQVHNQILSASNIEDYATRLYQAHYYGGVHHGASGDPRDGNRSPPFLPAEKQNIEDYAKAIQRAMPGSVPADTEESIQAAKASRTKPFAPLNERLTAKDRLDGKVKTPNDNDAKNSWNKSRSSAGAYGVSAPKDFDQLAANNGFVSFTNSGNDNATVKTPSTDNSTIDSMLAGIAKALESAASKQNTLSIIVKAEDLSAKLEYARILAAALKEELLMHTRTYISDDKVEVRCEDQASFAMIKAVASDVAQIFNQATNSKVSTVMTTTSKDEYQELDLKTAELHYRKFRLKLYGKKHS